MVKSITNAQKAKIFALCRESGVDNDLLHELVYAQTGCDSIRQLTMAQGIMVIDRLEGRTTTMGMATPGQRRFIESLARQLGWVLENRKVDMARLEGFLKAKFQVGSYKSLTVKKASEVIEALKDMNVRNKS